MPSLFCKPMKARNKPIPADEEIWTGFGTSLASFARNPMAEIKRNIIPSMKTAANADSYGILPEPWKPTTVYAKYALVPIPGAKANGKLAKIPMITQPMREDATVATIRSFLTELRHVA
ncbi:hypothetical protein Hanom_Chr07g00676631 [Helianthus anomalus]